MAAMAAILDFQSTIFIILDLQVTPTLPTKFPVDLPFSSGEKRKIDIQDGDHLVLLIQIILAIFDLQVAPKHPIRFRVNWPFH